MEETGLPEVTVGDGEGQEAGKGREEDAQGPEEAGANAGKKSARSVSRFGGKTTSSKRENMANFPTKMSGYLVPGFGGTITLSIREHG